MIALALGLIVGLGLAFLLGKVKGRSYELTMALYTPLFVYIIANGLSMQGRGNIFVSTPLGDFQPGELAGVQTFLALILTIIYTGFRGKRALTVDEFPSVSLLTWILIAFGIGLTASESQVLLILGLALYILLGALSRRNPLGWLRATPCQGELADIAGSHGLSCLTDEDGLTIYRVENTLVVGGRLPREFSRWKDVVECMTGLRTGRTLRVIFYLVPLALPFIGVLMGPGVLTALVLAVLAVPLYFGLLIISVRETRSAMERECEEAVEEYAKFVRERKRGKREFVIG